MGLRCGVYFGMMVVLMLCYGARGADDNSDSCASSLTPCALYLNSTNPPKSCCDPLLAVIQTQQKCLCNLLSSVPSLGINLTQALELPARTVTYSSSFDTILPVVSQQVEAPMIPLLLQDVLLLLQTTITVRTARTRYPDSSFHRYWASCLYLCLECFNYSLRGSLSFLQGNDVKS